MSIKSMMKLSSVPKHLAAIIALAIAASFPVLSQTTQTTNVEQEVLQLDRELLEARRKATKGDTTALDRILADDFIATGLNSRVVNKAQYIKSSTAPNLSLASLHTDDVKVRVYGDSAVVTGRTAVKGRYNDEEFNTQFRYTRTYVKRDGRWQLVSSHLTLIKNP